MPDIIFEHRNKEYGAYALRRGYASTMSRSLFSLQQRLQDPRDGSEDADGQVKVKVMFVVSAEGEVGAFKPVGEAAPQFSEEVVRVLRKMPRWKPARQKGRPVAMYFALPVVFDHKPE